MRAVYKLSLLAAFTVMGAAACADILGFERFTDLERADGATPPKDGATTEVDAPPIDPRCEGSRRPPARPDDAGAGTSLASFSLAVSTFDIGIDPSPTQVATAVGLDIDGVCTVDLASSSCTTNVGQVPFNAFVADKPGSVDNAGFGLLRLLGAQYESLAPAAINEYLKRGVFGFMIDIEDYNGEANDSSVKVALRPTLGIKPRADGGTVPAFDGKDEWVINEEYSLADAVGRGKFLDVDAYVRDGVLVAQYSEAVFPISKDTSNNILPIKLRDLTMMANIVKAPGGWELQKGLLAGGWATEDAFVAIRNYSFAEDPNVPLCDQPDYERAFRQKMCEGRDLPARLTSPKTAPCESVSTGFSFAAKQAINSESSRFRSARAVRCLPVTCDSPADAGGLIPDASDGSDN
jgi:hypothetical protein